MTNKITSPDGSRLTLERPVLKAREIGEFVEARVALQRARETAERLRQEARHAYEQAHDRGYQDGVKAGSKDSAAQMIDIISGAVDYLGKTETQVAAVVIATVSKILGDLDQDELILKSVRRSLSELRDQQHVTVRAAPRNANTLLDGLPRNHPEVGILNVVADERLNDAECVIETDMGIVNVNRDEFLTVLKNAIVKRLGVSREQFETELEQQLALQKIALAETSSPHQQPADPEVVDFSDVELDLSRLELEPLPEKS